MHSLLRRQLRQHRIDFESLPVAVKGLLEVVDKAYQQFDDDRAMLERAFELSSEELIQVNEELSNHREQLERLVNMRTRELTKANSRLIGEVAERKRLEERLANLSECLINLTENHAENTGRLVNLCGTSLDASHAFYNHVAGDHVDHICSWSADGEPAGCFHHVDHGFCLSFINDLSAGVCVNTIRRPAREEFSDEIADRFDPCVGIPVSLGSGKRIGALCVVNRDYQVVSEADKRFLRLLASALGSEEEREWTANALRESEEKFRSISMSAQDAIVMANRGGNISYWNPAAEGIIGYDREEILGRSIRICIPSPAFDQAFASLFTDDRGVRDHERPKSGIIEVEAKRKDGGAVAIELSLSAVAFDNERHAIVIFRDVSKRKNAVQELRNAAAAAEAASRAKSQFLANMSHEIRTPINGVLGMSELLQGTELTPEQRRFANTIQRSGEALLGLINDILDFSKIEAGKMELRSVDLSLRSTVAEMVEMLLRQAQRKGLSLTAHTDRGVPDSFIGDPLRIQQVLMNLATNAVKFTDNGEVSISVFCTEQDEERAVLRFEVRDTGIGVPVEAQSAIFDSFSQADGSATRRYGGSGLGLAIAKQLCGMMGGSIGVNSTPGKGSVFWFTIKLLKQPNGGVGAEGSISPPENTARNRDDVLSLHVLLVEDNRVNQQVAKAMLETMTCRVDVAGDGAEAVAAVKNKHYDVVLMDCQMPSMDGYEATKAIREWESERYAGRKKPNHIPIIALTAHAMKGDRERCIEAGMDDYLSKPYKLKALSEVLAPYVSKNGEELPTAHPANDGDNGGVPEASWLTGGGTPIEGSVDWSVLDRLRGLQMEGAPDVVASIINIYLVNSPTLLGQAQQALTTGDSETLRRASHTLKSSSANVGALMLSEMCRDLETLARANALANDEKQATRLFAKISDEFTRVRDALSTELVL